MRNDYRRVLLSCLCAGCLMVTSAYAVTFGTDNLNGRTIQNHFSMYLAPNGTMVGRMQHKPGNQPRVDTGHYRITKDGTFYMRWHHWDSKKQLCGHFFATKNAYMSLDCDNVFHTVFMKSDIKQGKHI